MARTLNRRAAVVRRDCDGQMIPAISPITENPDLLNFAVRVDLDVRKTLLHLRKRRASADWFLPGLQKYDVLGHQTEDGGVIARFARTEPGKDQIADSLFVS